MFPIRDHNPSRRTPYVTLALIAANVVVYLTTLPLMADPHSQIRLLSDWAMIPALVSQGRELGSLATAMFLHAGFLHLAGNMLFLWIFGDNLEDRMGHAGFLAFYALAGAAAGLAQVAWNPQSPIPMIGASGAIGGVMGGYLLMFPRARVDVLVIFVFLIRVVPLPAWLVLGAWFALQLLAGIAAPVDMGGVAYWAHAGGFLAGLALTLPLWLRSGGPAFWQRTQGAPPHPETAYARSTIPVVRRRR